MLSVLRCIKIPFIVTCLVLSFSVSAEIKPVDISGTYVCSGNDVSDNSSYTVELTVTKSGDIYSYKGVEKGMENKRKNFSGTGMFAKNSNTIFASEFWQDNDPTKSGVIINQLQPDGNWQGVWVWKDKPGINTEVCKKK